MSDLVGNLEDWFYLADARMDLLGDKIDVYFCFLDI